MRNPFKRKTDPFATNRWAGMIRGGSSRRRERKRPWLFRRAWRWVTALALVLLLAAVGYVWYRYEKLADAIQDDELDLRQVDEDIEPFNVLLVGSDSREGLTEDEKERLGAADEFQGVPITGERADTLIFARIDPQSDHITMVQFPRDLYVPIAGGSEEKINAALLGGRLRMVRTVENLTGLEINHYAQVNIAGFKRIVDAIEGVKLCITEAIPFDPKTGIEITQDELPVVEFDGERALRFVRSRNFPTGDFQRIQNQQKFLSAAVSKITSFGTFLDLGKINRLMNAVADYTRVDKELSPKDLYDLGQKFRSFDPENYEAYTAPNLGTARIDAGSVVLPDMPLIEFMFEAIGNNESPADVADVPDVDVADVEVGIYNGSFKDGVAAAAADELEAAIRVGEKTISVIEIANADRFTYKQGVIVYDPKDEGAEEKAQLIAAAVPDARVKEGETGRADVEVIVGRRPFRTEKIIKVEPIDLPPPGTQPDECRRELG